MNLTLYDGDLLVRRDKPETETDHGIVIPDAAVSVKLSGTVVLAAKTMKDGSPARYKEGDRVLFRGHMTDNFANVTVDGGTLILMPSHWCWAKIGEVDECKHGVPLDGERICNACEE